MLKAFEPKRPAQSGCVRLVHLLHAVGRIPGSLELAHVEDLPGVIGVVGADVGQFPSFSRLPTAAFPYISIP